MTPPLQEAIAKALSEIPMWFQETICDQVYPQFTPAETDAAIVGAWERVRDRLEIRCVGCRMSDGRSHDLKDCRL